MSVTLNPQLLAKPFAKIKGVLETFLPNNNDTHFNAVDRTTSSGQVYIVGAGPGDAELLTLKAYRLLQEADVVLFDWLVDESVLALIPRQVNKEFVGKRSGKHSMPQHEITQRMVYLAQQGKRVVRLKGGDPAVFARTVEETDALTAANIPFAIVPGITTASGASAYTGIPLTERECAQGVRLITAHQKNADAEPNWSLIAHSLQNETVVFYMGLKKLPMICNTLQAHGVPLTLHCAVVDRACCPEQKLITGTVSSIADQALHADLQGPALLIFGHVVSKKQAIDTAMTQALGQIHGV